jgi:peptidoglycan/LPS O-acetylase OafA/YrhL
MTSPAPTLADRIAATGGRTSGFDYMRLLLSVTVVLSHGVIVSYGQPGDAVFWDTPLRPVYRLVLPMFFALSGYLVAGSLERSRTVGVFLGLRVIRIYPALTVEVLLSAFILGPWMTNLGLQAYFGDPQFRHYLLNILGDIH